MTMKRRDFYVSLSYSFFLSSLLFVAACSESAQKSSASPISADVSCDSSNSDFTPTQDEEALRSLDLTVGRYEYVRGEAYFTSDSNGPMFGVSSRESITRNTSTRGFDAKHTFVCRSGLHHPGLDEFRISDVAPALILVRDADVDYAQREYVISGKEGHASYEFNNAIEVKGQHRYTFERELRSKWSSFRFVHTGVKSYAFIASKKTDGGTFHIRVDYYKSEGNILTDGDIFLPLPDIHF